MEEIAELTAKADKDTKADSKKGAASGAPDLDEIESRIIKEFATTYDYVPGRVKEVASFVKAMHVFTRYLGEKYYSESMGKRIHLLALDLDALILRSEHLRLMAERFYSALEKGFLQHKKVTLDKKQMDAFKRELDSFESELDTIYDRAMEVTKEIRAEFERKEKI